MLKKLVLAASGVALLLGALVVPVAAADDVKVYDVNGIPGMKIDVCSGGEENVSWLKYGKHTYGDNLPPGTHKVKVKKAARGKCRGRLLAVTTVTFEAGKNYTLLYWKPKGVVRLKLFENDISIPEPGGVALTMRHGARAAAIDAWTWQATKPAVTDTTPTFDAMKRGQERGPVAMDARPTLFTVLPDKQARWDFVGGSKNLHEGGSYQAYLLGTNKSNYRIKVFGQAGTAP